MSISAGNPPAGQGVFGSCDNAGKQRHGRVVRSEVAAGSSLIDSTIYTGIVAADLLQMQPVSNTVINVRLHFGAGFDEQRIG